MESAKQNLKLIDTSSQVSGRKEADIPLTVSAGLKIHALGKGNLLSDLRRPSQIENQKIGKKVAKAQLINKLNFVNFQDDTILINLKHGQYDKNTEIVGLLVLCASCFAMCVHIAVHQLPHCQYGLDEVYQAK